MASTDRDDVRVAGQPAEVGVSERFSLRAGHWYAAEIIGAEFGRALRSYSPIKVLRAEALRSGERILNLDFYHANYPEGVRDKSYRLRVLERCQEFLLARSEAHAPARYLLVYRIDAGWLHRQFGVSIPAEEDLEQWLDRNA